MFDFKILDYDEDESDQRPMVQILLPQICSDAARATIVFLYTDVLPPSCLGESVEVETQGEK